MGDDGCDGPASCSDCRPPRMCGPERTYEMSDLNQMTKFPT